MKEPNKLAFNRKQKYGKIKFESNSQMNMANNCHSTRYRSIRCNLTTTLETTNYFENEITSRFSIMYLQRCKQRKIWQTTNLTGNRPQLTGLWIIRLEKLAYPLGEIGCPHFSESVKFATTKIFFFSFFIFESAID